MSPNAGGRGGVTWSQTAVHRSPNKLWRSNSIFNLLRSECDGVYRSGPSQGLEMLLDAETYDNGDPDAESDGFHILITDNDDASLVIKHPSLTTTTMYL
jgi:hypothetical protein